MCLHEFWPFALQIVLEFISDYNYVRAGFLLDFLITDCPRNCSGHGSCVGNKCYCDELFTGVACDIEICPDFCNNATGNGQCSQVHVLYLHLSYIY